MGNAFDDEIQLAIGEGFVELSEADDLRIRAQTRNLRPLKLLREEDKISEHDYKSLHLHTHDSIIPRGPASHEAQNNPHSTTIKDEDYAALNSLSKDDKIDFPAALQQRFKPIRLLGQGGMGSVFLANDERLSRLVALKLVRNSGAVDPRRFLFEARAQAKVDHERVCRVYEVGEIEGELYISMQFIDGPPLSQMLDILTVEQKVMLVRDTALGVNAAHQVGLIHRDLKPSNIIVEGEPDNYRAFVVDFGLARSVQDEVTLTGTVLGSPPYMAPEQARGETNNLDRRTDVYSLGATLYTALTKVHPIEGANPLETLANVIHSTPKPLTAIKRNIPSDLEAIVLQCLQKERSDRYSSARALAEDLNRFLVGDPVEAQANQKTYRLKKWLKKYAFFVNLAALVLFILFAAFGWGIWERQRAFIRERLAQHYTELADTIDGMARYSTLSPLHDIRADQASIRERIQTLEKEIDQTNALARGVGHYALGKGYFSLGDYSNALKHLELAWENNYREPRVAYVTSLVYGQSYQEALIEAKSILSKSTRTQRIENIRKKYREPALKYLRQSQGADVPSEAYLIALIAFFEGHLDEALASLDTIGGNLAWFYEAPKLRGDILLTKGLSYRNAGQKDLALKYFKASRQAYLDAARIGESSPALYTALGALENEELILERYGQGRLEAPLKRGLSAINKALQTDPEYAPAHLRAAMMYRRVAEHGTDQSIKVEKELKAGVHHAELALKYAPNMNVARLELARLHRQWGDYLIVHQKDPRSHLEESIQLIEAISESERNEEYYSNRGAVHRVYAQYLNTKGDTDNAFEQLSLAIQAYQNGLAYNPNSFVLWANIGINYNRRAKEPSSPNPEKDILESIQAFEQAEAINKDHMALFYYESLTYLQAAYFTAAKGQDPGPHLKISAKLFQRGAKQNPKMPQYYNGQGQVSIARAQHTWDQGRHPIPLLNRAIVHFRKAIDIQPNDKSGYSYIGYANTIKAWYKLRLESSPLPALDRAQAALNKALSIAPNDQTIWPKLALAHSIEAESQSLKGSVPTESLNRAKQKVDLALSLNSREPLANYVLARIHLIQAQSQEQEGKAHDVHFRAAEEACQLAKSYSPKELYFLQVTCGEIYIYWSKWLIQNQTSPQENIRQGLRLTEELLDTRPNWSEIQLIQAALMQLEALAAQTLSQREQAQTKSDALVTQALRINSNLNVRWQKFKKTLSTLAQEN